MSEITTTELIERLQVQHLNLLGLLEDCHKNLDRENEAADLVAKAADLVREARRCVEHPNVRRTNCVWVGAVLHVLRTDKPFHTVCGVEPDAYSTFLTRLTVPDCEQCIAVIASEAKS